MVMIIYEYFTELRRQIDKQQETLKKKIDDVAFELIEHTKIKERSCYEDLIKKMINNPLLANQTN